MCKVIMEFIQRAEIECAKIKSGAAFVKQKHDGIMAEKLKAYVSFFK